MFSPDKIKVLVVDDLHPAFMEQMNPGIFEIFYQPQIEANQIADQLMDMDILVVRSKVKVNKSLCGKANKLKMIVRAGAGMDNIDLEWAKSEGIECINAAGSNRQAVGEQALDMLLSLQSNVNGAVCFRVALAE